MKYIPCLLLVGALTGCFLFSCKKQSPYSQSLAMTEQIMDEHPDSAYIMLQEIPLDNLSRHDYAVWRLLFTQAMDKQYMTHASDSLIKIAADYFGRYGNAAYRTKAYYYMGRVNQDLGNSSLAQQYYLKALESGKSSGNHRQLALIHSNLGMLYTYQDVYDEALLQMKESARLFIQSGDSVNNAYILRNIGRTYHVMDSIDLAISYYQQALAAIDSTGRTSVLTELGDVLISKKSYTQAETYLREALQSSSSANYQFVSLALGCLFEETDRPDSARFYLKESLNSVLPTTKAATYYYLAKVDMNEENWKESAESLWSYFEMHEAIRKQRDAESIRKIQSLFNFNQIEEERNRALQGQIRVERIVFLLLIILVGLSISTFIGFGKIQKQKKERESLLLKNKKIIVDLEQNVIELESQIEIKSDEKENLSKEIHNLQQQLDHISFVMKEDEEQMKQFINSDIYKSLQTSSSKNLTEEEKNDLIKTIDELWPNFRLSFKTLSNKVSDEDILMCCLLKTNIRISKIASWMNIEEHSITMKRKRLAQKMFGEMAVIKDLDDFISHKKALSLL